MIHIVLVSPDDHKEVSNISRLLQTGSLANLIPRNYRIWLLLYAFYHLLGNRAVCYISAWNCSDQVGIFLCVSTTPNPQR